MKRIAALLVAVALCGSGCTDTSKVEPNTVKPLDPHAEIPSQISYNTAMNFSSAGLMRAILHAGRVQTFDTKHYTLLDSSVRVDFFDKLGLHSSRLTSRMARINLMTNNMTAYDHVHIVSDSGTVVDTDSLEWDNSKQTLHSDAAVRIAEKNGRITKGTGFESDQSLTHYTITHPVIEAPASSLQQPGSTSAPQPQSPAIPGAGAFGGPKLSLPPPVQDTGKK